ncbi:MAG: hypothetical protein FRX49_11531 [Trebouxia sp. A1-2]|nr:MAG: hypothetical protein FRX49_11531 [Trebouxia sp. A1-2]
MRTGSVSAAQRWRNDHSKDTCKFAKKHNTAEAHPDSNMRLSFPEESLGVELGYLFIEVVAQCFDVSSSFDPESNLAFSVWDVCIICVLRGNSPEQATEEVGSGDSGDEELAAIGVGPSIGHGQQSRLLMRELKGFIFKLSSIDRLSPPVCLAAEHGSNISMLPIAVKVPVS